MSEQEEETDREECEKSPDCDSEMSNKLTLVLLCVVAFLFYWVHLAYKDKEVIYKANLSIPVDCKEVIAHKVYYNESCMFEKEIGVQMYRTER